MASARMITDHEEIRKWAEERNATPTCVKGTGDKNDPGMIRLDFPGYSGADSLEPVDWDTWFNQFDENNLGLLVQDVTAKGDKSNFNKLVSRDNSDGAQHGKRASGSGASKEREREMAHGRGAGKSKSGGKTSSSPQSAARSKSGSKSSK